MGDSQRQLACVQQVDEHGAVRLAAQDEIYLAAGIVGSAGEVIGNGLFEVGETGDGVVEVRYRLGQIVNGVVRQHTLEFAECLRSVVKSLRAVHTLTGVCVVDIVVAAPEAALAVYVVGLVILGEENIEALPLGVAAGGDDLLVEVVGNAHHVFHQGVRLFEHICVKLLNEIFISVAVFLKKFKYIGIVDMTVKEL